MKRTTDPDLMTPTERLLEVASILAAGFRRVQLKREKGLATIAEDEALCVPPVDGEELEAKEMA